MGTTLDTESYPWGHKHNQWLLKARPKVANHSLASTAGFCFGAPCAPYRAHQIIQGATRLANGFWKPCLGLPIIFWQALLAYALVPHGLYIGPTKLSMGPQA